MLKKILLSILGIIVLLVVISFFMSGKYHAEKSLVMKAQPEVIFDQLNTLKNWEKWEPWGNVDTTIKMTFNGPESGVGASYSWTSKKSGDGTITISESVPPQMINYSLDFAGQGKALAGFKLEPVAEGTNVTWWFDMDAGSNPIGKYMIKLMDGTMQDMLNKGLANIKGVVEAMPPAAEVKIEITEVKETPYLAVRTTATGQTISAQIGSSFGMVQAAMKEQNLNFGSTPPLCIYYKWENNNFEFDAAIPTDKPGKDAGNVKAGALKTGRAAVAHYYGAYDKMMPAYNQMQAYIKANNLKVNGPSWEVYITDPMTEKDTAKWQTDIYFPVD